MRTLALAGWILAVTAAHAQAPVERVPPPPPPAASQLAPQQGATMTPPPPPSDDELSGYIAPPPDAAGTMGYSHQPPGAAEALAGLTSQPATRTAFSLDRDMLEGFFGERGAAARLQGITVENFRYREPAFYVPEAMHGLIGAYQAAGWKHLVEQHVSRREEASPTKPLTDLWLHFHGAEIDHLAVLIRGPRNMSLVEVSGDLRPLDLLHLGGRFGIPKVDPGAVMVPADPGR